jgi:hypothetical protein
MRWVADGVPDLLDSPAGLVRWRPIEGATGYEVWFQNVQVVDADGNPAGAAPLVVTTTNSADEREYYTFHQPTTVGGQWTVEWRVRAIRTVYGALNNALPSVSYGPWSPVYANENPALTTGPFTNLKTTGEPAVAGHDPSSDGFQLTPGFAYDGDIGEWGPASLYRIYVFSDRDCVNPVFKGSVIGGPAYAPRASGALALPTDPTKLAKLPATWLPDTGGFIDNPLNFPNGLQQSYAADNVSKPVEEREAQAPATFSPTLIAPPSSSTSASTGSAAPPSSSSGATIGTLTGIGAPTGLWDNNWANGSYYWTVVAVQARLLGGNPPHVQYVDEELPQDACQQDLRVASFKVAGQRPATLDPTTDLPYAWGLSTSGRLRSASTARPTVAGSPLVAWQPALPATAYEVQWSKSAYPWRPYGNLYTYSTSTTLPLKPGRWYYRVRGINMTLPTGASTMAWSQKVGLVVAKPKFKISK